tara:strand:- start:1840 stop:2253 length:414 start_codon:yes stop_codon:yes gene_type:complete
MAVYTPGLGNVASYQVSGKPFVSGSIDLSSYTTGPLEISFPSVTRWILVRNFDTTSNNAKQIKVAASANGFITGEFFRVNDDYSGTYLRKSQTPRLELKLTKLYLTGSSTKVDVIAGLTGISTNTIENNWSGSEGVG